MLTHAWVWPLVVAGIIITAAPRVARFLKTLFR